MGKAEPPEVGCAADPRGLVADAFFGASPVVASALGIRLGATPRGHRHSNTHPRPAWVQGDIFILLERGTFSLCLDNYENTY